MASNNKSNSAVTLKTNKRKHYLPHNKPVKKKGAYPLKPGVQGFFITCDGGRERQASHEAITVIEAFFEELLHGKASGEKPSGLPKIPQNKKITFSYSDDEEEDDGDEDDEENADGDEGGGEELDKVTKPDSPEVNHSCSGDSATNTLKPVNPDEECDKNEPRDAKDGEENGKTVDATNDVEEPPAKKQCVENVPKSTTSGTEKSIDKLIDAELNELGDKSKRRFFHLDAGCNGLVFIQMRRRDGDPSPTDIVQHLMTSAAASKKHMSRFILRVLPIELSCYTSDEEISRAIKPLVEQYFPVETEKPQKFAVLYGARANTGIDRMKIINSVAKSIPAPHKVDLNNPDKTIVVEIVKTVCLIGIVEKYKELAKFNLRQLTSSKD